MSVPTFNEICSNPNLVITSEWSNKAIALFHYHNPKGLIAQKKAVGNQLKEWHPIHVIHHEDIFRHLAGSTRVLKKDLDRAIAALIGEIHAAQKILERENDVEALMEEIAKHFLEIETLETRNSDSLDFHEVSVDLLREALKAAYQEGRRSVCQAADTEYTLHTLVEGELITQDGWEELAEVTALATKMCAEERFSDEESMFDGCCITAAYITASDTVPPIWSWRK